MILSRVGEVAGVWGGVGWEWGQAPELTVEARGSIEVKGKGRMFTYWVRARSRSPLPLLPLRLLSTV